MNSPFPGMDPYLERHWGDVHRRITTYICDSLQSRLPEDLRARMQERIYIELPHLKRAIYYPDVTVVDALGTGQTRAPQPRWRSPTTAGRGRQRRTRLRRADLRQPRTRASDRGLCRDRRRQVGPQGDHGDRGPQPDKQTPGRGSAALHQEARRSTSRGRQYRGDRPFARWNEGVDDRLRAFRHIIVRPIKRASGERRDARFSLPNASMASGYL